MAASLTETSILTRKIIRYSIYGIIGLVIARSLFNVGSRVYQIVFPPPPPTPTVGYGKLPLLPIDQRAKPEGLTFKLETTTGKFPELPDQLPIYFMPKAITNIRSLDIARDKAQAMGFSRSAKKIAENIDNVYVFESSSSPSNLTINITNGTFAIGYDLNSDPQAISKIPPTEEVSAQRFKSFLSSPGVLTDDLSSGRVTTEFLRYENGKFVPALSLSDAQAVKVNIFRKVLGKNEVPSVTPNVTESNVWGLVVAGDSNNGKVIQAEYHYYPLDEKRFETYPLKTAEEAWKELENGNYLPARVENTNSEVVVRKVYLAYYDPGQYTAFYQPVYVFEGDNNFVAYVPAVRNEYYGAVPQN